MKNKSLKGMIVLAALIAIQTGCNSQDSNSGIKEKTKKVVALRKRARFLRHEGDIDSSLVYYKKSLILCYAVEKQLDSTKDTIYNAELAKLSNDIGYIYDSLHNYDSALPYLMESLKWAKLSKISYMITADKSLIGFLYYDSGNNHPQGSADRKTFYLKGIIYLKTTIRNLDSLNLTQNKTEQYNLRLHAYDVIGIIYKELGDANQEEFYINKYNELKAQLNEGSN